jgi:hypothetical protein
LAISLKQAAKKLSLFSFVLLGPVFAMYSVKAPALYEAIINTMTDEELVNRFTSLLQHEMNPKDNNGKIRFFEDSSLLQLPIYRIATLKAIVNEIKKRQDTTGKHLLTDHQIMQAKNLITSKEATIEKGMK